MILTFLLGFLCWSVQSTLSGEKQMCAALSLRGKSVGKSACYLEKLKTTSM